MNDEIIVAPATAPVNSALALLRVSGAGAVELIRGIFPRHAKIEHARAVYGPVMDGERRLDDVVLTAYFAPASFTGEDTVELSCHGNPVIMRNIVAALLARGARLAGPGEFSRRAFLNGKMDLTEAEAVNTLIHARSDWEIGAALEQMHGGLRNEIGKLRERLIILKGDIESAIDFAEEEIEFVSRDAAISQVELIRDGIDDIRRRCRNGSRLSGGIDLPIVGKPNSGKSSLLNLLLNQDRAIVSSIPGTTRDTIREHAQIGGIHVNLYDTAGIREASCEIERVGIGKSEEILERASIALLLLDAETGVTDEDRHVMELCAGKNHIAVINKLDVAGEDACRAVAAAVGRECVFISARTGEGLAALEAAVTERILTEFPEPGDCFVADMRVLGLLDEGYANCAVLRDSLAAHNPPEYVSRDIAAVIQSLGEITGEISVDDVLNSIFSRFCIGK